MFDMQYSERLPCLNLESLQIRRLKCDLILCYKIIHSEIPTLSGDFLVFSDFTRILEGILTNCSRAVLGLMHRSISCRTVLLKSEMLCLVQS